MTGIDADSINNLAWLGTLQTLALFVMVGIYALWHHHHQTKKVAHPQLHHERHRKTIRTLSNILHDMTSTGHVLP